MLFFTQSWLTLPSTAGETKKLFDHLNVIQAHLDGTGGASLEHVTELRLLYLTPRLRVSHLHYFSLKNEFSPATYTEENDTQSACSRLNHLYMTYCGFDPGALHALQEMIERHSVQKPTLWRCYTQESINLTYDYQLIEDVYNIFPTAVFLPWDDPNPIEDWGLTP